MEPEFWIERWSQGQTAFHRDGVHPDLLAHQDWFLDGASHRVLVPLCGKSHDLPWLAARGHHVVGTEISPIAARAVFEEHGLTPSVEPRGAHTVFCAGRVEIWCGDHFALPTGVGPFDRVWDRAALVAVEPGRRAAYVAHTAAVAGPQADVLLNVLNYDPAVMSGPPFPVRPEEVRALFGRVARLSRRSLLDSEPRWRERGHRWFETTTWSVGFR